MSELTIHLTESLREFVETQAACGGHGSAGAYIKALIREAQGREAAQHLAEPSQLSPEEVERMLGMSRAEIEAMLLEGLRSPASEMTDDDWAALRRRVIDRSPELQGEG